MLQLEEDLRRDGSKSPHVNIDGPWAELKRAMHAQKPRALTDLHLITKKANAAPWRARES